ncbi:Protein of unknown function [Devosia psychrophila]|uniref:Uncharacterized protein n=1 Tax=Devosia psychrophila TaxID=728005 RepID=A0A1I1JC65_9HYPH|nr:Protein of unknown function [Devosia psychrophila]
MTYISGFVAAVPAGNKDKYRKFAEHYVDRLKGCGAMRLMEA